MARAAASKVLASALLVLGPVFLASPVGAVIDVHKKGFTSQYSFGVAGSGPRCTLNVNGYLVAKPNRRLEIFSSCVGAKGRALKSSLTIRVTQRSAGGKRLFSKVRKTDSSRDPFIKHSLDARFEKLSVTLNAAGKTFVKESIKAGTGGSYLTADASRGYSKTTLSIQTNRNYVSSDMATGRAPVTAGVNMYIDTVCYGAYSDERITPATTSDLIRQTCKDPAANIGRVELTRNLSGKKLEVFSLNVL
jgi:hypothetical protein